MVPEWLDNAMVVLGVIGTPILIGVILGCISGGDSTPINTGPRFDRNGAPLWPAHSVSVNGVVHDASDADLVCRKLLWRYDSGTTKWTNTYAVLVLTRSNRLMYIKFRDVTAEFCNGECGLSVDKWFLFGKDRDAVDFVYNTFGMNRNDFREQVKQIRTNRTEQNAASKSEEAVA
jgi:hypothetical protein